MSPFAKSPKKAKRLAGLSWSREDEIALVEYVVLHQDHSFVSPDGDIQWPSTKNMEYWDEASVYMQTKTNSASRRPGTVYTFYFKSWTLFETPRLCLLHMSHKVRYKTSALKQSFNKCKKPIRYISRQRHPSHPSQPRGSFVIFQIP